MAWKKISKFALVSVLALALTGCFTIDRMSFTDSVLDRSNGDTTNLRAQLRERADAETGFAVIVMGYNDPVQPRVHRVLQDPDNRYSANLNLIRDDDLRPRAKSQCQIGGASVGDMGFDSYNVFRTTDAITPSDNTTSRLVFKHGLKPTPSGTGDAQVLVAVGIWTGTAGDPNSGLFQCFSGTITSLTVQS